VSDERKIFASRLNHYMALHGKTQTDLIHDLGINKSTISTWCSGVKMPRMGTIQTLAGYFGVMKSDLIEDKSLLEAIGAVPYNPTHKIRVLGHISAGLPLYAEEQVVGEIYTELNGNHEYYALQVRGDSMNNRNIEDGSIVIIQYDAEIENGDIAVVMVGDTNATIKQFFRTGTMVTLVPHSNNPEHIMQIYNCEETEIKLLGKLVRVIIDF